MQTKSNKGAVIYTRVSTGEQAKEGTSLESQRDACRARALQMGLPIVAEYEDAGVSGGFLIARGGMQAALADIRTGRADTLICANLSRYSRDVEHQQRIMKEVRAAGGRVAFCDMDFDDTPEGDLAFNVLGGFAQYERQVIRSRTMRGKQKRAEQGVQPARTSPPCGYAIPTKADILRGLYPPEMLGRYIILESEAEIVRWIFESYAQGLVSLSAVAQELNRRGFPTRRGAKAWGPMAVRVILTNPVYIGQPAFGKTRSRMDESRLTRVSEATGRPYRSAGVRRASPEEAVVLTAPPLVSEELFEAVQARMGQNQARKSGNPKRVGMLAGLLRCPVCGYSMFRKTRSSRRQPAGSGAASAYYQCGTWNKALTNTGQGECTRDAYRSDMVEEAVIRSIEEAAREPQALAAALASYLAEQGRATEDEEEAPRRAAALDRELAALDSEEAATVKAQIAGIRAGASPDAYAAAFEDIRRRREAVLAERAKYESIGRKPSEPRKTSPVAVEADYLNDICRVLRSAELAGQERRNIISQVVHQIHCQKDGARIYFSEAVFPAPETDNSMLAELMQ